MLVFTVQLTARSDELGSKRRVGGEVDAKAVGQKCIRQVVLVVVWDWQAFFSAARHDVEEFAFGSRYGAAYPHQLFHSVLPRREREHFNINVITNVGFIIII
jgi:hypothetical protein